VNGRDELGHGRRVGSLGNLVSDAPDDDARVVAVASDVTLDISIVPGVEESPVIIGVLARVPTIEGLIHHQEPQPIGNIQELWCGRVMRGAKCVVTHVLEQLKPLLDGACVHG
jgi:hypothetical protein